LNVLSSDQITTINTSLSFEAIGGGVAILVIVVHIVAQAKRIEELALVRCRKMLLYQCLHNSPENQRMVS